MGVFIQATEKNYRREIFFISSEDTISISNTQIWLGEKLIRYIQWITWVSVSKTYMCVTQRTC